MPRPPSDPSGATKTVCVSLPPDRLTKLDTLAASRSLSRSAMVTRLIDRAEPTREPDPTPLADIKISAQPVVYPETCDHNDTKRNVDIHGVITCATCGAKQGSTGKWGPSR